MRLEGEKKQLEEERDKLERDRRHLEFTRLLGQGEAALTKKAYEEAERLFGQALQLVPSDGEALKGLVAARTAGTAAARGQEEEAKRQAEVERLLGQGKEALADKQYGAAVRALDSARQ